MGIDLYAFWSINNHEKIEVSYEKIILRHTLQIYSDEVFVELTTELGVSVVGVPKQSEWTTLAFTSSYHGSEDNDSLNSAVFEDETDVRVIEANVKSKSDFMRLILSTQMLDLHEIGKDVIKVLREIKKIFPKLNANMIEDFKKLVTQR